MRLSFQSYPNIQFTNICLEKSRNNNKQINAHPFKTSSVELLRERIQKTSGCAKYWKCKYVRRLFIWINNVWETKDTIKYISCYGLSGFRLFFLLLSLESALHVEQRIQIHHLIPTVKDCIGITSTIIVFVLNIYESCIWFN